MDQALIEAPAPEDTDVAALTALDRCDSCGAQAYVRVHFTTGDLLFCAHHATRHEEKFAQIMLDMQDEREKLTSVAKLDVSPM